MGHLRPPFNLFLSFLSTVKKNLVASRIQTQIFGVKVKYANHYTTARLSCCCSSCHRCRWHSSHRQHQAVILKVAFLAGPFTSLAGLQSTVTTLPYANKKTEVLSSLPSIPIHIWAVASKYKLPNERH